MKIVNDNVLDTNMVGEAARSNGMYVKSKLIELLSFRDDEELAGIVEYLAEDLNYYKDTDGNFQFIDGNGDLIGPVYIGKYKGSKIWNDVMEEAKVTVKVEQIAESVANTVKGTNVIRKQKLPLDIDSWLVGLCFVIGFAVMVLGAAEFLIKAFSWLQQGV